jgi:hypothetical protein
VRPWLAAVALAGAVIGIVGEFRSPVNGDVAYMLDAAARMLGGAQLYTDLLDLNPPFMFWLSQPAIALADGPAAVTVFRVMVILLGAAMLALAWPVTRGMPALRAGYVLTAFALPLGHFGEREHLIYCLVFPYVALGVSRASGGGVGTPLAAAIGISAGIGMAIKPPAVLLALALAAYAWWRRRSRATLAPEHLAVAATLALALGLILVLAPDYLRAVTEYGAAYAAFSRGTIGDLLFGHLYAVFTIVALVLAGLTGVSVRWPGTAAVLAVATLALLAGAVAQGKGFGYHYLPAYGFAVLLMLELILAAPNWRTGHGDLRRIASGIALVVMIAPPAAVAIDRAAGRAPDPLPGRRELSSALGSDAPGTSMAMLSIRLGDTYPLVLDREFDYALSMPHLWFSGLDDRHGATASLWQRVASDVAARRPDVIVSRAPSAAERGPGDIDFDYLRRVCDQPGGPAALRGYGLASRVAGYDIYRRDFNGAPACASS